MSGENTFNVSLTSEQFQQIAQEGKYNTIPLYVDLTADCDTPLSAYFKLRGTDSTNSFLLESVEKGERQGRYSFVGARPARVFNQVGVDPLLLIEKEMKQYTVMPVTGLPSFSGGVIGYVSYDCVQYFESSVQLSHQQDSLQLPDSIFFLCDCLIVFDHLKHSIKAVVHAIFDNNQNKPENMYKQALIRLQHIVNLLKSTTSSTLYPSPSFSGSFAAFEQSEFKAATSANVTQTQFESHVNSLKQNINQGDIIQAVPSQRIEYTLKHASAFDIYRQLRVYNPSPYMFFFDFGSFQVVGASPEQLLKVHNGIVTTHPIAGTRRRGDNDEQDEKIAKELLANEKERAEHIMLVDLGRNDIGRVAEAGSVKVDSLMHIEKFSNVMHIVSHVSGKLAANKTMFDAFRAVFPAGTVSGAPKIRAMQLVSSLEQQRRSVYAGAIGYIGWNSSATMDMCIAIRTMVVKDSKVYFQAGAGIVFDSVSTDEYHETLHKMGSVARAVIAAEQVATQSVSVEKKRDTVMKNRYGVVTSLPAYFGKFGGRFVPEILVGALEDLEKEYIRVLNDASFKEELRTLQKYYVGRPTPMYYAKRLTEHCGGARIWLKREDLAHTGAHKINNALGQALLAKRMGKKRIICETGAGQHGVATATACALLDLNCVVYMGEEDVHRQALNVFRMKMLGATVVPVTSGTKTLKDAVNEAMRDWVTSVEHTFFLIGSAIGPHPFPTIVRDFQCVLGEEVRAQMLERTGKLPDVAIACVGGGSNSIGLFHPLVDDGIKLIGVEAGGHGISSGMHSATLVGGSVGVLHGTRTYLLQDADGQITGTHSISAGLDYPGVGPEHAFYKEAGLVQYVAVTDQEALQGLQDLTRLEGLIPALEPSHAIYYGMQLARQMKPHQDILINLCGRGDKDMYQVADALNVKLIN